MSKSSAVVSNISDEASFAVAYSDHTGTSNKIDSYSKASYQGPNIIVNELLTFVSNKIDILTHDDIVKICTDFYEEDAIIISKKLAFDLCENNPCRFKKRQGNDKSTKNVSDILALLKNNSNAL